MPRERNGQRDGDAEKDDEVMRREKIRGGGVLCRK